MKVDQRAVFILDFFLTHIVTDRLVFSMRT